MLRHRLAPPRSLPPEPESVLRVIDRVGSLQFDPLEIAGRNHDLVLLARIAGYRREWTEHWLYEDRRLYETYSKGLSIVPVAEMPWYRLTWDQNHAEHTGGAFDVHAPLVEELLARIRDRGPLLPRDVGPRAAIDWYWRPTNQVRAILEALAEAGIVGIWRREGNLRVYDLVERLFPAAILTDRRPERDQRRHRLLSRYRAGGLLGTGGQAELWLGTAAGTSGQSAARTTAERGALRSELIERGELLPVTVEGFKGERFIVGSERGLLDQARHEIAAGVPPGGREPGVAFLAPLDPFCWDRDLLRRLFEFDYIWEVYVPAAKRRWGYYVLPILYGDRLVGRIEPRIERRAGRLRIAGLWWEDGFDPLDDDGFAPAFAAAIAAHRDFGDMSRVVFPRTVRHRPFLIEVRAILGRGGRPGPRRRGGRARSVGRCGRRHR